MRLAAGKAVVLKSKTGRPSESTVGSGQFGTPWERMHWLNFRMPLSSCGTSAVGNWSSMPAGSRCWQALSAAWYWELLTPSCCALGNFALAGAWLGVGEVRHAVGAHALGEGEQRGVR